VDSDHGVLLLLTRSYGKGESVSPYQSPESPSRFKKLLEYLLKVNKDKNDSIKEQNKALIDNIREDIKAFRKSIEGNQIKLQKDLITEIQTEIERSFKGTELESQKDCTENF
jgi:septal ring factor EnvC (AmiA/AmiB activator)